MSKNIDSGTLMNSIREMVRSEAQTVYLEMNQSRRSDGEVEKSRLNYSKHETIVREGLETIVNNLREVDARTSKMRVLGGGRKR